MQHFFMLIFFSFWGGVLLAYIPLYKRPTLYFFAEFFKGVAVAAAALFFVGTPTALVVAGFGLLAGNLWFPLPHWKKRESIYGNVSGLLLFLAPDLFLLYVSWVIIIYLLRQEPVNEIFMSFYLLLPLLMLLTGKSDIYILFSTLILIIVLIDNLKRLEDGLKIAIKKAGWKILCNRQLVLSPACRKNLRRVGYVSVVLLLLLAFFLNRYVYRGFGMQVELFRSGPKELKVVALTFDDGPDPRFTPLILDILEEYDIKATFFMVGKHAEKYPHIARLVEEAGHEIGNHTYSHANLLQASAYRISNEITRGEEAILNSTGKRPSLLRPPRGLYNPTVKEKAREMGYTIALWSLSSNDWLELRPLDITRRILRNVSNGDIILFHDSGDLIRSEGGDRLSTVLSLKPIIEGLKEQDYIFVTITEMMILSGLSGDI